MPRCGNILAFRGTPRPLLPQESTDISSANSMDCSFSVWNILGMSRPLSVYVVIFFIGGQFMNGILPLWKDKGLTSHDCVVKVRNILHTKKVGHTGTLDPEVEGVLPICIGEATKIVPFLTDTPKTYVATLTLGTSTDTEDQTGEILQKQKLTSPFTEEEIKEVLGLFVGEISQQVPLYSAVKVNGMKLYEYARANLPVERPFRQVTIHDIHFISSSYNEQNYTQSIQFEVVCSKGTYIRTLCVEMGKKLGLPAHMSSLVRTASDNISELDTLSLEKLTQIVHNDQQAALISMERGLLHLGELTVDQYTKQKVLYGQKLPLPEKVPITDFFRVKHNEELLAIYQLHPNGKEIKPARVFNFT